MHQIKKRSPIPDELQALQKRYPQPQYADWEHMHQTQKAAFFAVRDTLAYDQGFCCVYCEICLDPDAKAHADRGHIEHHRPKSRFVHLMFDWHNLMYCCTTPHTCGMAKRSHYFEGFLNPYCDPVEEWLHTNVITGALEVNPTCPQDRVEHARESIATLNLNDPGLKRKRESLLRKLTQEIAALEADPDALIFFKASAQTAEAPFVTARLNLLDRLIPEG